MTNLITRRACIVFSYVPIKFGPAENNAIRSADPENPNLEQNKHEVDLMIRCGDIAVRNFPNERSVVRRSVVNILSLMSCIPLRYAGNVAREE